MWHVIQILALLGLLFGIGWWVIKKIQESDYK